MIEGHYEKSYYFYKLGTILLVSLHALLYLFTIWSIDVKCVVKYARAKKLADATHVKVIPHAFTGSKELVPIQARLMDGEAHISFSYRKLTFMWNGHQFEKLLYPTHMTFAEYRRSGGYGTDAKIKLAEDKWGLNKFEVPMPHFIELLKEQLLAPFFCFQVFCVGLWALDEYWYYSLFTLFMLVSFESTVVGQRLKNLKDVRSLQQPKQDLQVYRRGGWIRLPGDHLLPGDVVSLGRPAGSDEPIVVQADALLLAGTAIVDESVLTGESTPQWKNPVGEATGDEIDSSELDETARLSIKRDKAHVLFGGTKLLQATGDPEAHIKTPDGGCLAVILRTGYGTAQGRLMRTILYSTERVSANNMETFFFILFLLVWAIAASAYVLRVGLEDPDRDRFKLILNCIMIITSVIPPELPMELTIAVNASLLALARKRVFCTEPFRIPMAGKVTTCCFDKTGTLTSDQMVLEGIAGMSKGSEESESQLAKDALSQETLRVLACCQSLVQVEEGQLVGDPVETAAITATGWSCQHDKVSDPKTKEICQILHRYHFNAVLKRMSTVVKSDNKAKAMWWVLTKGAPEIVKDLLASVPPQYDQLYRHHASHGGRVLALAYKKLPMDTTPSSLRHLGRDQAESELTFGGFAVFRSPLKGDSEPSLLALREAGHQLVMITGDAPLTACHAARAVHILTNPVLLLSVNDDKELSWISTDGNESIAFSSSPQGAWELAEEYDFCVTGDGLAVLSESGLADLYVPLTQVFARVTPEQKELAVKIMRAAGLGVLMCGDGTNDVGALKGAHVGVALLPPPPPLTAAQKRRRREQGPPIGPGTKILHDMRRQGRPITPFVERMAARMDEMASAGGDMGDAPMVRPGDASMAAPFTAKQSSVGPCLDILKQGRCTLITTVQMFKILGLLCLSSAYSLSVMYMDGIKLGDFQATLGGVLSAGMFFFISNAKPLEKLSKERPHQGVFSVYVFTSLLGQFAIYISFLMYMQYTAHALMDPEERQEPDTEFKPNLINTVCFLVNFVIQTMTFAVNYVGEPFNTPLSANKPFMLSIRYSVLIYIALVLDIPPGLSSWFSLVSIPRQLQGQMLGFALLAGFGGLCVEKFARAAFPAPIPPVKGGICGPAAQM